jgi:predicted ABC-type exoprotein transport system permease subunit
MFNSKVIICILAGLGFAYIYYSRAQQVWSWPVAVCLSVLDGLVVIWFFRRGVRVKTQNHKKDDDAVA